MLAQDYAPDIKLLGTVATGASIYAPFDPPTKARQIPIPPRTGGGFNGLLPLFHLYTYAAIDPSFDPSPYVSDGAKPVFEDIATMCISDLENVADEHHVTAENVMKKNPEEEIARGAAYLRYPIPRFLHPLFIGSGLADTIALPEGQYDFVKAACSEGSTVEAHYYAGKDHSGTVNASLVDSMPFVKKVFNRQAVAGNCSSIKPPVPDR